MKFKTSGVLMVLACTAAFGSCKKADSFPRSGETDQGIVTGTVTDEQNNPVKGADIIVEHTVWLDNYLFAISNDVGKYEIILPENPSGDWTVKAQLSKAAYGQTYKFDLEADNTGIFNNAKSDKCNFKWKLSGVRNDGSGYYGAHIDLYPFATDVDMSKIKILLTPFPSETTLIDGSIATTFERAVEEVAGIFMVKDVPIGKYTIQLEYPGRKLLLNNRDAEDQNEEIKTVVFGKNGFLGETEYNIEFYVTE